MLKKILSSTLTTFACIALTGLLTTLFCLQASAQYRYIIQGKLAGGAGKTIYLSAEVYVPNSEKGKIDSAVINQTDEFKLSGEIGYAGLYALFFANQRAFCPIILDTKSPVIIQGHSETIYKSLVSSPQQQLLEQFERLDRLVQDSLQKFHQLAITVKRQQPIDSAMLESYVAQLNKWNTKRAVMLNEFASSHPGSYVTLQISESFLGTLISHQQAEVNLKSMSATYNSNPLYQKVSKLIAGYKASQTGMVLADFALPDSYGKQISTKELRKKKQIPDH